MEQNSFFHKLLGRRGGEQHAESSVEASTAVAAAPQAMAGLQDVPEKIDRIMELTARLDQPIAGLSREFAELRESIERMIQATKDQGELAGTLRQAAQRLSEDDARREIESLADSARHQIELLEGIKTAVAPGGGVAHAMTSLAGSMSEVARGAAAQTAALAEISKAVNSGNAALERIIRQGRRTAWIGAGILTLLAAHLVVTLIKLF